MGSTMPDPGTLGAKLRHLAASADNGRRAKARLAAQLAKMPVAQLRKVDPAVLAALGPDGMKLFALARKTDTGLKPVERARPGSRKPGNLSRWHRHPWVMGLSVALLCAVAGAAAARSAALAMDSGVFGPVHTYQGWPVCRRLDMASHGCVYRTTSDNLTIEKIMALTRLAAQILVSANPHIDFHYRLSPGTVLIVPGTVYR